MIPAIAMQELRRLFLSPLAWTLLAGIQLVLAWVFLVLIEDFLNLQPRLASLENAPGVTDLVVTPSLRVAAWVLLLVVPLLTMRSISEERRQHTLTLLLSAPLAGYQIVLGKFLGLWAFLLLLVGLAGLMPLTLSVGTEIDLGKLLAGILGLSLMVGGFAAAGLCLSTLTAQPAVAAAAAFGLLLLLWIVDLAGGTHGLLAYLSVIRHYEALLMGLFHSADVAFYALFMASFLGLAIWRLNPHRPRLRQRLKDLLLLLLFGGSIGLLGWLSTRYPLQADWSFGARNTLSAPSRQLLERLDGPIEITAFARDEATLHRHIGHLVERYRRHKPDTALRFVDPDAAPERVRDLGITLNGELYLEYQGRGERVQTLTEQGLTRALQALVRRGNRYLLFLDGHGERKPLGPANHDLGHFGQALARTGLKIREINPIREPMLPDNTAALVIASPQIDLLPGEVGLIRDYLERGGNLLWLAEPEGEAELAVLAKSLGIRWLPGVVVDADAPLLGIDNPTFVPVADYGPHPITAQVSVRTLFPSAAGLEIQPATGWDHEALLMTQARTWTETGPLQDRIGFDAGGLERAGPLTLGVALWREQPTPAANATTQRVVVIGDGDFLSNAYLGNGGNLDLGLNIVNWLSRDEALIDIHPRPAPDVNLALSDTALAIIGGGFLLVLPAVFFASGWLIRWRRRRY